MELNADFSQRVLIHAATLPWTPSPIVGVQRRMLDRIGEEVARATSIVRYAPNSRFSAHAHDGGEEFFVLDGTFQDEYGDYPAGSYIRNPPTSQHTPRAETGCIIFVKLRQFDPADRTHVRVDTPKLPFVPVLEIPGIETMPLFRDSREDVRLERWTAGAERVLFVEGGMELLVLEGKLSESGDSLQTHSWLRLPKGATLRAKAGSTGCKVWLKSQTKPGTGLVDRVDN